MIRRVTLFACSILLAPVWAWACTQPVDAERDATETIRLTNAFRDGEDLAQLAFSAELATAAQRHACDMAVTGAFSHTGTDGSTAGERVTQAGYTWRFVAENIAYGQDKVVAVMSGWRNSPGHNRNMLHKDAKEIGIGLAEAANGQVYWVMVLGQQR